MNVKNVRGALVAAVAAVLVAAGGAILSAQATVDLTGKWLMEVTTDAGGTSNPTMTIKQAGDKLSGHYSSETLGEADFTGAVTGQDVEISFNVDMQGTALAVVYKAKLESATAMKGTISIPGLAEGTFSAKKE
jgi:hypothetical protein